MNQRVCYLWYGILDWRQSNTTLNFQYKPLNKRLHLTWANLETEKEIEKPYNMQLIKNLYFLPDLHKTWLK